MLKSILKWAATILANGVTKALTSSPKSKNSDPCRLMAASRFDYRQQLDSRLSSQSVTVRSKRPTCTERAMKRRRDYKAEYIRRKALGLKKGLSLSQLRGHPKPGEKAISPRMMPPLEDERLQRALR